MRTTLTLDGDVATQVEALRRERGVPLKALVNDALRLGLREMTAKPAKSAAPFQTRTFNVGRVKIPCVDNISEVLALAEGDAFK